MIELLEKFKKVDVKASTMISPEDQTVINKIQAEYLALVYNLTQWKEGLFKLSKQLGDTRYYELERRNRRERKNEKDDFYFFIDKDLDHERSPRAWTTKKMFAPAFGLLYIEETLPTLIARRNKEIVSYFNSTYNLAVSDSELAELVTTEEVVDFIISENEGKSLVEASHENIISNFKREFGKADLIKSKVVFPYVYFGEHGKEYSKYSKPVAALIQGISYFENGTATVLVWVFKFFQSLGSGRFIDTTLGDKFKGIRFYKNHKCELHFVSDAAAKEFFDMFRLFEAT